MNERNQDIKKLLVECILELSDKPYQERVWLRGEGLEVGSAGEFFCTFFDDLNVEEIIENYTEYKISEYQLELLKELYKVLDDYSDSIPMSPINKDVLLDPRWHKIRDFAKKVYSELTDSSTC